MQTETIAEIIADLDISIHVDGFAEPGYLDSGIIALADWNSIEMTIQENLKSAGVELLPSVEWMACDQCRKLVRIRPDSNTWKRYSWTTNEGRLLCGTCVLDDPADYLQFHEGREDRCVTIDFDLTEFDYLLLEDAFERGFFPGQDASPTRIAKALRQQGIDRFIFRLDKGEQFAMSLSVYVHREQFWRLDVERWEKAEKHISRSKATQQYLIEYAKRKSTGK